MLSPAREAAVQVAADVPPARARRVSPEVLALLGLTLLAAVLRFATLSSQSLWFDEAQAVHEVQLSFGGLMNTIGAQETSPPLFFVLGWVWAKVFGAGAVSLRSISAIAGTALVPLTYLAGRELVSRRAGFLAGLLAAVSPFMIWYSQEAREYMLLAALCTASLLFFARALHGEGRRDLVVWTVVSALALLTHFFAGFLVFPEAVWLVLVLRRRDAVLAAAAVVVVELALIPLALSDAAHPLGWLTAFPLSTRLQQVPVTFALGTLYRSSIVTDGPLAAGVLGALVVFLVGAGATRRELRGTGIAAAIGAAVIVLPLLAALVGHDFVIARALIPAWAPIAIVLGAACTVRRLWPVGGLLAAVAVAGSLFALVKIDGDPTYQRPDWRGVASALGTSRVQRAVVVYEGALASDPLKLYLPRVPWDQPAGDVRVGEVDVVASVWQSPARRLPAGVSELGTRTVDGYLVARFALARPWVLTPQALGSRAGSLIAPAAAPVVLVQRAPEPLLR